MEVKSRILPVFYGQSGPKSYWRYKNRFFVENDRLELEDVHPVLAARDRRQAMQIQRAKTKGGMPQRGGIPLGDRQIGQGARSQIGRPDLLLHDLRHEREL